MLKNLTKCLAVSALSLVLVVGLACETIPTDGDGDGNGNGNGNGNGGGGTAMEVVQTAIASHANARIRAGDDLVAYGTEALLGVDYIIPSAGDTAGRGITDSDRFRSNSFAVAGKKIALVGDAGSAILYQVAIFDSANPGDPTVIPATQVRLQSIPVSDGDAGHIEADGDYVVAVSDPSEVADGRMLQVIDVSGAVPVVTSFGTDPASSAWNVAMVAVDAASKQVVAADTNADVFCVYDIDNPDTAPTQFDASGHDGIHDNVQMAFDGQYVLYRNDAGYSKAMVLDTTSGTFTELEFAQNNVALGGGKFGYFVDRDASDDTGGGRSAIGATTNFGSPTLAGDVQIDGYTNNNGLFGHGTNIVITPNGEHFFLNCLQHSTGGAFTTFTDPSGTNAYGCPGWDVSCTNNTVAFRSTTDGNNNIVAYIIIP
ncbi:MAG: hypothetical protein JXQ75_19685 [Phycisphaerae bacterium]|nr:hypothetical protein [Phycisphaerae bacterium]